MLLGPRKERLVPKALDNAARLAAARNRNLRQMMARSLRCLNAIVQDEVLKRGYSDIRPVHNTVLINLDMNGSSISEIAERADMAKQAVGVLVEELERLGYLARRVDPSDGRARIISFTERGERLIVHMLEIIEEIESSYVATLGLQTLTGLRTGLAALVGIRQLS